MEDFYKLLGVGNDASYEEIKERYRYLAMVFHPDRFKNEDHKRKAEEDFRKINEAFEVLSTPVLRHKYDQRAGFTYSNNFTQTENLKYPTVLPEEINLGLISWNEKKLFKLSVTNITLSEAELNLLIDTSITDIKIQFINQNIVKKQMDITFELNTENLKSGVFSEWISINYHGKIIKSKISFSVVSDLSLSPSNERSTIIDEGSKKLFTWKALISILVILLIGGLFIYDIYSFFIIPNKSITDEPYSQVDSQIIMETITKTPTKTQTTIPTITPTKTVTSTKTITLTPTLIATSQKIYEGNITELNFERMERKPNFLGAYDLELLYGKDMFEYFLYQFIPLNNINEYIVSAKHSVGDRPALWDNQINKITQFYLEERPSSDNKFGILSISSDNQILAATVKSSSDPQSQIILWNTNNGEILKTLSGCSLFAPTPLIISNDNQFVMMGCYEKVNYLDSKIVINVWRVEDGLIIRKYDLGIGLRGQPHLFINNIILSKNKHLFAVYGERHLGNNLYSDKRVDYISLYDINIGRVGTLEFEPYTFGYGDFCSIVFSNDGTLISSISGKTTFSIWSTTNLLKIMEFDNYSSTDIDENDQIVEKIAISMDNTHIVSIDSYGRLKLWNINSGELIGEVRLENNDIPDLRNSPLSFSEDDRELIWGELIIKIKN